MKERTPPLEVKAPVDMRFKSKKLGDKSKMPMEYGAEMKEAWASSVWGWFSWWWSFSYSADRAIWGTLWLSKWLGISIIFDIIGWGDYAKNEVVTWEAFLTKYDLVEAMTIFWRCNLSFHQIFSCPWLM